MPASGDKEARKRLGRLLKLRRVEMDPRYRNRTLFATERGINYRLVQDIENAARSNFDDAILAFISLAYGWTVGSAARVLEGGEPVLAAGVQGQSRRRRSAKQPELSAAEAEALGREVFRVIQGGGGEVIVPQAIADAVRAAHGLKPRRKQGNDAGGA